MDKGVLTIETDYSDSDFKIEWEGIKEIYSKTKFLITLSSGTRYNGPLKSSTTGSVIIDDYTTGDEEVNLNEIVFLKSVDDGFKSRLYANIDLGFSITKANNLRQVSMRSKIGYLANAGRLMHPTIIFILPRMRQMQYDASTVDFHTSIICQKTGTFRLT